MLWFYFLIGFVGAFVVAAAAGARGRSRLKWFIYGLFLWPIALIHVLVLPRNQAAVERRQIESGAMRKCPHCAEVIRAEAKVCRFCGRDVMVDAESAAANAESAAANAESAAIAAADARAARRRYAPWSEPDHWRR